MTCVYLGRSVQNLSRFLWVDCQELWTAHWSGFERVGPPNLGEELCTFNWTHFNWLRPLVVISLELFTHSGDEKDIKDEENPAQDTHGEPSEPSLD
jgi:hypothetical protein